MVSPMMIYCVVSAINNLWMSFALGVYVLVSNGRLLASRLFAAFAASVGFWSLFYVFWMMSTRQPQALFAVRALMAGAILIPTFFLHFVVVLLGRRSEDHRLLWIGYACSAVFLGLDWTPLFVAGVAQRGGFPFWPVPGPAFHLYLLYFSGCVVYAHWLMYRQMKVTTGISLNQIRPMFFGTLLGFLGGATNFPLWYGIPIPPVGNVLVAVYVAMCAYAIIQYSLLDIKIALTQSGLLLAIYVVVLGVPFALAWWGEEWLRQAVGLHWWVVPQGLSIVMGILGPFTYGYLRQKADQWFWKEFEATRNQAMVDGLTGVLARQTFLERAEAILRGDSCRPATLLMIDLDQFKVVNDAHGHLVGDAVLQEVACRLVGSLRRADLAGRFGGEEFILLLPNTDGKGALIVAERLRRLLEGAAIKTDAGLLAQTVSIGLASIPRDGTSLEGLIAKADAALYIAKRQGRNQVAAASQLSGSA